METIIRNWTRLRGWARKAGPYLMLEALLPGGTLLALMLLVLRHRRRAASLQPLFPPARALTRTAPRAPLRQRSGTLRFARPRRGRAGFSASA